jgi:hypothetical protein
LQEVQFEGDEEHAKQTLLHVMQLKLIKNNVESKQDRH